MNESAQSGPSQTTRLVLMTFALVLGVCGGLYSNGVLDPILKRYAPSFAMKAEGPTIAAEPQPAPREPAMSPEKAAAPVTPETPAPVSH